MGIENEEFLLFLKCAKQNALGTSVQIYCSTGMSTMFNCNLKNLAHNYSQNLNSYLYNIFLLL
jgi:hypothetical protein